MSYQTAEELKLPQWLYDALLSVKKVLKEGEVKYISERELLHHHYPEYSGEVPDVVLFNMSHWADKLDCGTVCCIGGLVEHIGQHSVLSHEIAGWERLEDLFYPPINRMKGITIDQALVAIENYLISGDADWYDVLGIEH